MEKLIKYLNKINEIDDKGEIYYDSSWPDLSLEHKDLVKEFCNYKNSNKIIIYLTRNDIINSYKAYYKSNADFLKPFLLTMIWGYGSGFGNKRTNNILAQMDETAFIEGLELIKVKKPKEAYNKIRVKGLGLSFISKILYFAGKAVDKNWEYPLIFDTRVAQSFAKLYMPKECFELISIFPSENIENYWKYNEMIHKMAMEIGVEADQIEMFLFDFDKNIPK